MIPVRQIANRFLTPLLDLAYPLVCLHCEARAASAENAVCETCWEELQASLPTVAEADESFVVTHAPDTHVVPVWSLGVYRDPLARFVHSFKYEGHTHLGHYMARLLERQHGDALRRVGPMAIMPVPLHKTAERQRGFNQAEIISDILSMVLESPILRDAAHRVRRTLDQTKLSPAERRENVLHAFVVDSELVAGQRVILVDDVITTGATIGELAATASRAGAIVCGCVALASAVSVIEFIRV